MKKVIVVGAGITGLMTALKLYRIGTWEKITEWIYRNKLHKKKGWFK